MHDAASEHDLRIHRVISQVDARSGIGSREPVYSCTPLDELIAAEEPELTDADEAAIRVEVVSEMLAFFFADGIHPAAVIRRVYALAYKYGYSALDGFSGSDIGVMLGETRQAFSGRLAKMFGDRVARGKRSETRAKYKAKAAANTSADKGAAKRRTVAAIAG